MMKPKTAESTTTLTIQTYFKPKMPNAMGMTTGSKKGRARMTGKPMKTTQNLNNPMPL